jgi:hypothetical protein
MALVRGRRFHYVRSAAARASARDHAAARADHVDHLHTNLPQATLKRFVATVLIRSGVPLLLR